MYIKCKMKLMMMKKYKFSLSSLETQNRTRIIVEIKKRVLSRSFYVQEIVDLIFLKVLGFALLRVIVGVEN